MPDLDPAEQHSCHNVQPELCSAASLLLDVVSGAAHTLVPPPGAKRRVLHAPVTSCTARHGLNVMQHAARRLRKGSVWVLEGRLHTCPVESARQRDAVVCCRQHNWPLVCLQQKETAAGSVLCPV